LYQHDCLVRPFFISSISNSFLSELVQELFESGARISIKKHGLGDFCDHNLGYENPIISLDRDHPVLFGKRMKPLEQLPR